MISEVSHLRGVLSNISGSLSIACWIIILLPQLLEQWRLKSADGVAIGFLLAWFFGDIANLAGSLLGQLRPNVILLALWFCFSDALIILSYCYYKRLSGKRLPRSPPISADSRMPPFVGSSHIVESSNPSEPTYFADSRQRSTSPALAGSHIGDPENYLATPSTPLLQERRNSENDEESTTEHASSRGNWLLSTGLPGIFVLVVATLSYFVSDSASEPDLNTNASAEFLGYISAALYITARIPQIIQNHRRRSVEGLSSGFFILSAIGNLTYAGQVILYRTDRDWLITYIPWLLGSLGTIAEDFVILAQFYIYNR